MRAPSNGFTVIELVLAIAVTSILAAVVVSAIRTHGIRTQIMSGIDLASPWETVVESSFRTSGQVPRTWEDLGAGSQIVSSLHVEGIHLADGRIDIVYGNEAASAIAGRRLSLTPYETASQEIIWVCGSHIPELGLQPLGFASGGSQATQVPPTVAARYLPAECR
jgi:prepilin-type N-terminal cleavage/methylation domain-containing protein